jgi:hypothetical protein
MHTLMFLPPGPKLERKRGGGLVAVKRPCPELRAIAGRLRQQQGRVGTPSPGVGDARL